MESYLKNQVSFSFYYWNTAADCDTASVSSKKVLSLASDVTEAKKQCKSGAFSFVATIDQCQ